MKHVENFGDSITLRDSVKIVARIPMTEKYPPKEQHCAHIYLFRTV